MSETLTQQSPAEYIHFVSTHPDRANAGQYSAQLKALLLQSVDHAGSLFDKFKLLADENPRLSSTFFTAVHDGFVKLHEGKDGRPDRWNELMASIATLSTTNPVIEKYVRTILLAKAIPTLVGVNAGFKELQLASDILDVAGRHENLQDAITPQSVRPVVLWHLASVRGQFETVAPRFTHLRGSEPFVPVIANVENRHSVHVDSIQLPHAPNKNLVLKFQKNVPEKDMITAYVVDLSKPGRANHPHQIAFDEAAGKYKKSVEEILLRASDLPDQAWVSAQAEKLYCHLG